MKILVACEESQAVTKALRALGHEAYSCDIIPCSGGHPEWHIMQDVRPLLSPDWVHRYSDEPAALGFEFFTEEGRLHFVGGKWDMIIAFPPCTYLTAAGACRMYPTKGNIDPERFAKAMEAKDFFMAFYTADCDKIAIENPRPLRVVDLPVESQRIQPYEYAEDSSEYFTKMTYLWLKGLPQLTPIRVKKPEGTRPFVNAGTKRATGEPRKMVGCRHSALERSKTFKGVARAMALQWAGPAVEEDDSWML